MEEEMEVALDYLGRTYPKLSRKKLDKKMREGLWSLLMAKPEGSP